MPSGTHLIFTGSFPPCSFRIFPSLLVEEVRVPEMLSEDIRRFVDLLLGHNLAEHVAFQEVAACMILISFLSLKCL